MSAIQQILAALGSTGGAPATAPRRRQLLDMSRLGMHMQRNGPVVYTPSVGGGTLSATTQALGTSLNLDTLTNWIWVRQTIGVNLQKVGNTRMTIVDNATGRSNLVGTTWAHSPVFPDLTCTNSENEANDTNVGALGPLADSQFYGVNSGTPSFSVVITGIGTTPEVFRVHWGDVRDSDYALTGGVATLVATLSDASAGPLTLTAPVAGADHQSSAKRSDITVAALSSGQTLTIDFPLNPSGNMILAAQLVAIV